MLNVVVVEGEYIIWSILSVIILEQRLSCMLVQLEQLGNFGVFLALIL